MKMQEAKDLMNNKPRGFMVSFDWYGDGFLTSDHFPDKHAGEKLIRSEHEAWELARDFARATKGRTCNLYVIDSEFKPVNGYRDRKINSR